MMERAFHSCKRFSLWAALVFAAGAAHAQVVIPQVVDGGGWQTTIVITNTTAGTAAATLAFFQDAGSGTTQSWTIPLLENKSTQNMPLTGGATIFLHTAGTASATTQGFALVTATAGVQAYAVYSYAA